ncbi:DUF4476 domain-containing protein [Sorangium sp. So ce542]|uniref:DUF4476 domain-containing protein n=1 Tax=Sorangium sp. So ce542 TaxID=3133316 RepID=UPI003F5F73C7
MRRPITLAAALAISIPAAAQAHEHDRFHHSPYRSAAPQRQESSLPRSPRGGAALHISPPQSGAVFVFAGHRLLGSLQQPGTLHVEPGRAYVVVAVQNRLFLWGGSVWATEPSIHLAWGPGAAPRWTHGQEQPRWDERQRSTGHPPRRELLHALDRRYSDRGRLGVLEAEARRRSFTTGEADQILGRFDTEQHRLEALRILQPRLVDPGNRFHLTRHFRGADTRHQAIEALHRQGAQRSKAR